MAQLIQRIQQDLSRGSNLVANPYVLGQQQGILYTNFILGEHGSLHVRDGTIIQTTSPDVSPNIRAIVKLFDFVTLAGAIRKLAIVKGIGGNDQLYNRGTTPWTSIGTFGTKYAIPDILTFTNLALIVMGNETPWQLNNDGVTLTQLTDGAGHVPAGGQHHALHQGYYWLWHISDTTTTYDGPSSLRSTDLNNPNSWPIANQVFVNKDDGDFGNGMGQFTIAESGISPSTSQILFKQFSAYQMTGVFGSTNPPFAIQRIKSDMGCVAPRTIRFAPGFGLLRLTHRGIALFDGVDDRLVSEEVRPLIFGSDTYSGIDWTTVAGAYAEVVPNPPLYLLFAPVSGAALTRVFCYDLVRKSWTILYYAASIACAQTITDPNTLPVVLVGDYNQGNVRSIFNPPSTASGTDDGTPIAWSAVLRPAHGSSPQQRAYFRRAILKVFHTTVDHQQITWQALFGPVVTATPVTKSGTITLPAKVSALTPGASGGYGQAPYGNSPYGGNIQNSEADATIDLGIIADNARMILTGSGHLVIRGLEWHVRAKPVARPSVFV